MLNLILKGRVLRDDFSRHDDFQGCETRVKRSSKEFVIFTLKFVDKSTSIEKRFLGHYRGTA